MSKIIGLQEEVLARALRLIAEHPSMKILGQAGNSPETGSVAVEVEIQIGLPNAWKAKGVSPNGVRAVEPVTLEFPAAYPLKPPTIRLRSDFNRNLAHIAPGPLEKRPEPCLFEGSLAEIQQDQGLAGILNQLVLWLENAALGRLNDPRQGWEPIRRDELDDVIVADAGYLRSLVSRREGSQTFQMKYLRHQELRGKQSFLVSLRSEVMFNHKTAGSLFEGRLSSSQQVTIGQGLAIFVWPGKHPSGEPVVADQYRPETVTDIISLKERADNYGCLAPLNAALDRLQRCLGPYTWQRTFPIAVILCARRPFHMIGSESELELCPYVIEIGAPVLLPEGDRTPVRPAGHRHVVSVPLLQTMSEGGLSERIFPWVQIGAGSLGSKIALHLGRMGRAPSSVIDRSWLSPHNAARHALVPSSDSAQISWNGSKAGAVADALAGLGQRTEAYALDIVAITRDALASKKFLPKNSWALVNSTASLTVREALASVPKGTTIPRVIETSLFAQGQVGLLSVEGADRNPNIGDLITETYFLMRWDETLLGIVFGGTYSLQRQVIGEGCGSTTMVMSDARISMLAAPMAEFIATLQREGLSVDGQILLGVTAKNGLSLSWSTHDVRPWLRITVEESSGWEVRISDRVNRKIEEEVTKWPAVETGGILVGRFSEAARTFYVVDVLPAPEDSTRSAAEFVLGTAGVRSALTAYAEPCNYSLYCLGTWHSHLRATGPSPLDRATAAAVALARPAPSVLLIHTPKGYRALLAFSGNRR